MVNPVALLGAAPVFIPAPSWLRDRTLHEIQLTCSGTGMTSTAPPTQRAPAGYDAPWRTAATPVDPTPQTANDHTGYEDEDADDERRKRTLVLLVGLFVGIPLAVLVLTIAWVYLPNRAVNPSSVTGPVPPSADPAPVGPTTAASPNAPPSAAPTAGTRRSSAPTVGKPPASAGPRVPSAGTAPQPPPAQQPNVLAPQPAPEGPPPAPFPNVLAPQPPLPPNVLAPPPGPAPPPPPNLLAPQPPLPNVLAPKPAPLPTALAPAPAPPPDPDPLPPGLGDSGLIQPEIVTPEPNPVLIPPPR
jgi:hypothetical protein